MDPSHLTAWFHRIFLKEEVNIENSYSDEISILVVEDDPSIRAMLRRLFSNMENTTVTFCGDGEEALREYQSGSIELIIIDLGFQNSGH